MFLHRVLSCGEDEEPAELSWRPNSLQEGTHTHTHSHMRISTPQRNTLRNDSNQPQPTQRPLLIPLPLSYSPNLPKDLSNQLMTGRFRRDTDAQRHHRRRSVCVMCEQIGDHGADQFALLVAVHDGGDEH
jgi:hypothetical protein